MTMFAVNSTAMRWLAAAGAVVLMAAPALAANENILEPRFDLTIWTIVIFVLLFLVLKKYAWAPILKGLRLREDNIERAVEEAKIAREETIRHKAEFEA